MQSVYTLWLLVATLVLLVFAALTRCKPRVALNPDKFVHLKLIKRIEVSKDSFVFRFAFANRRHILGLPVGHHIQLRAVCATTADDARHEAVQHSYTPITSNDEVGYVDFLVKVYFANVHPRYPAGGRLSQHLYKMRIGDTIEARGPKGNFIYEGHGVLRVNVPGKGWQKTHTEAFAMVAGGTGITPLLQVMQAIYKDPTDMTRVYLLYSNHTEDDILMRGQLDALARHHAGRFYIWYTLTAEAPAQWSYSTGRIDDEMLRRHLPVVRRHGDAATTMPGADASHKDSHDTVYALMCGPSPLVQQTVRPGLEKLGYAADMMFAF